MDDHLFDELDTLSRLEIGTPSWRDLAERILASSESMTRVVAYRASHQKHLVWGRDHDDVVQIVRQVHRRMLDEVGVGRTFPLPFEAWEASLLTRARSAVREVAESSQMTGISGYTGVARRQRALHELRERFEVDLGEQLSDEELADTYNDRLHPDDDDDRRVHGAEATPDDLHGVDVVAGDDLAYLPSQESVEHLVAEQLSLETTTALVARTIAEASAQDPRLGEIARAWLSPWPDGDLLSAAEVARMTGVSTARVRKDLGRLRAIFVGVHLTGGGDDATSLAVARTIAEAHLRDDRLGRVAELRFSRWSEQELVPADQIATLMERPRADIDRALAELETLLEGHLVVDGDGDADAPPDAAGPPSDVEPDDVDLAG